MPPIVVREPLTDGVVAVRPWRAEDIPVLVELLRDPDISRWTTITSPYTRKDARIFLRANARQEAMGLGSDMAVTDQHEDDILGGVGVRLHPMHGSGEIGYWVAADHRRQGVATRAVRLVAAWAFGSLQVKRLELLTLVDNEASERVARACGFCREGVMRSYREMHGERVDLTMFSLLPADHAEP